MTTTTKKPVKRFKKIIIIGRKWFDKSASNTYHTVVVDIDGIMYQSKICYGYDDQYIATALKMIQSAGFFKNFTYSEFCSYRYIEKNKSKFFITVSNVNSKKDL